MAIELEIFDVKVPRDCEGKSGMRTVGLFTTADLAKEVAMTGYGNAAWVSTPEEFLRSAKIERTPVWNSFTDFAVAHPDLNVKKAAESIREAILRERALAKLTPEERAALGVK